MIANNNILRLSYSRGVSDKSTPIINAMKKHKNILLVAPMRAGKTHFQLEPVTQYFNPLGVTVVTVAPFVRLIDQAVIRGGVAWDSYTSKHKARLDGTTNIETTPESYPNVVKGLEEANIRFVTLVDEAHTIQGMKALRPSFDNILKGGLSPNCVSTLYMTATPQVLEESRVLTFDCKIELIQDETIINKDGIEEDNPHIFKHGEEFRVHSMTINPQEVTNLSHYLANKYNASIVIMNNDKRLIEDCITLSKHTNKDIPIVGITSESNPLFKDSEGELACEVREDATNKINSILRGDKVGSKQIIHVTSCFGCGIEIQSERVITIDLTNRSYNYIDNIQFTGRNRNGVLKHILVLPESTKDSDKAITNNSYDYYYRQNLDVFSHLKAIIDIADDRGDDISSKKEYVRGFPFAKITDEGELILDELVLEATTGKDYYSQNKHNAEETLKLWRDSSNLNFTSWGLFNEDIPNLELSEQGLEHLKVNKEVKLAKLEELKSTIRLEVIRADEGALKEMIDKGLEIITEDGESLGELIEELNKEDNSLKRVIKSLVASNYTETMALKVWATHEDKELRDILDTLDIVRKNSLYTHDKGAFTKLLARGSNKQKREASRIYHTRLYFEKRDIKRGAKITREHLEDLIEIYAGLGVKLYVNLQDESDDKKKKALVTKVTKDLQGYLGQLYKLNTTTIKGKTYTRYLSIRRDIDDML